MELELDLIWEFELSEWPAFVTTNACLKGVALACPVDAKATSPVPLDVVTADVSGFLVAFSTGTEKPDQPKEYASICRSVGFGEGQDGV